MWVETGPKEQTHSVEQTGVLFRPIQLDIPLKIDQGEVDLEFH
jgi:hypothetical protein